MISFLLVGGTVQLVWLIEIEDLIGVCVGGGLRRIIEFEEEEEIQQGLAREGLGFVYFYILFRGLSYMIFLFRRGLSKGIKGRLSVVAWYRVILMFQRFIVISNVFCWVCEVLFVYICQGVAVRELESSYEGRGSRGGARV